MNKWIKPRNIDFPPFLDNLCQMLVIPYILSSACWDASHAHTIFLLTHTVHVHGHSHIQKHKDISYTHTHTSTHQHTVPVMSSLCGSWSVSSDWHLPPVSFTVLSHCPSPLLHRTLSFPLSYFRCFLDFYSLLIQICFVTPTLWQ